MTPTTDMEILDGDTFQIGDASIRLIGVDAPEIGQPCRDERGQVSGDCAEQARRHLETLIRSTVVVCVAPDRNKKIKESFGRPILNCQARTSTGPKALNKQMVADGFAIAYRGTGKENFQKDFAQEQEAALTPPKGLMVGCFVDPKKWRARSEDATALRQRFMSRGLLPTDRGDLVGAACGKLFD